MVEEEKEAVDFIHENDDAPENLVPREINHPPEEEKKANTNESRSDSDSGFNIDFTIQDVHDNVKLNNGET